MLEGITFELSFSYSRRFVQTLKTVFFVSCMCDCSAWNGRDMFKLPLQLNRQLLSKARILRSTGCWRKLRMLCALCIPETHCTKLLALNAAYQNLQHYSNVIRIYIPGYVTFCVWTAYNWFVNSWVISSAITVKFSSIQSLYMIKVFEW